MVLGNKYSYSYSHSLITFFNLKFIHSIVYNAAPQAFINTWPTNRSHRTNTNILRPHTQNLLRNDDKLFEHPPRTESLARFPLTNLPKLWNSYPTSITSTINKLAFSLQLKNHLLNILSEVPLCHRLLCPVCHLNRNTSTKILFILLHSYTLLLLYF